jgi:predicted component of type VI protein secretion system
VWQVRQQTKHATFVYGSMARAKYIPGTVYTLSCHLLANFWTLGYVAHVSYENETMWRLIEDCTGDSGEHVSCTSVELAPAICNMGIM